jgi:hypothetical protein
MQESLTNLPDMNHYICFIASHLFHDNLHNEMHIKQAVSSAIDAGFKLVVLSYALEQPSDKYIIDNHFSG